MFIFGFLLGSFVGVSASQNDLYPEMFGLIVDGVDVLAILVFSLFLYSIFLRFVFFHIILYCLSCLAKKFH